MNKSAVKIVSLLCLGACTTTAEPTGVVEPAEVGLSERALVLDFGLLGESSWYAVNDTVMGGVSDGIVDYTANEMRFEGVVSTDSNGGFTSVRSPDGLLDLSGYERLVVRVRSEGQPFSMVLSHNRNWYEGQYRYDLPNSTDEWQTLEIPLETFQLYTFSGGYPTATGDWMQPEDRREIFYTELMSKLFEDGPFQLEVDYIAFD